MNQGVGHPERTRQRTQLAYDAYSENRQIVGLDESAVVGHAANLSAAKFILDTAALTELLGDDTYADYLPNGIDITANGTKWILPKAGKVVYNRKVDGIDESKLGENPSGLRLAYRTKDGTFSGSFKAYTSYRGKPKATTVSVSGVMIDGKGYGTATVTRRGSVAVRVE